jgi:c-di-GMP-binding flagellar brake protein YcgR
VVIKEKVIKEYIKLPKVLKKPLSESIKHLRRQNKKISINIDGFFED